MKKTTDVDTLKVAKKALLASLKSVADKSDIDKLKTVPFNLTLFTIGSFGLCGHGGHKMSHTLKISKTKHDLSMKLSHRSIYALSPLFSYFRV